MPSKFSRHLTLMPLMWLPSPPEWANSVAESKTWRTIEVRKIPAIDARNSHRVQQAEPVFLPHLIGKLDPSDDIPIGQARDDIFADTELCFSNLSILRERLRNQSKGAESQPTGTGVWTGRVKLVPSDGRKVVIFNNQLTLASSGDEVIFTILDGNIRNTQANPSLTQVCIHCEVSQARALYLPCAIAHN